MTRCIEKILTPTLFLCFLDLSWEIPRCFALRSEHRRAYEPIVVVVGDRKFHYCANPIYNTQWFEFDWQQRIQPVGGYHTESRKTFLGVLECFSLTFYNFCSYPGSQLRGSDRHGSFYIQQSTDSSLHETGAIEHFAE